MSNKSVEDKTPNLPDDSQAFLIMNVTVLLYMSISLIYAIWSNSWNTSRPLTAEEIANDITKILNEYTKSVQKTTKAKAQQPILEATKFESSIASYLSAKGKTNFQIKLLPSTSSIDSLVLTLLKSKLSLNNNKSSFQDNKTSPNKSPLDKTANLKLQKPDQGLKVPSPPPLTVHSTQSSVLSSNKSDSTS